MSKHTRAPWFQSIDCIVGDKDLLVARLNVSAGPPETINANGRLITSAPELLAATKGAGELLRTLLPLFSKLDDAAETNYADGIRSILGTINLIVDRAEGRR